MRLRICLFILMVAIQAVGADYVWAASPKARIAMLLWRGETDAERGFRDGLKDLGYQAAIDVYNAKQNKGNVGSILRTKVKHRRYDYVYTFGTTVSLLTKSYLDGQVPHIFNIVADPVGAGLVKTLDASGGNLCGVKSGVPLRLQIETAHKILGFKRLGYIFNSREKNSNVTLDSLIEIAKDLNFQVVKLRSPPAQERLMMNLKRIANGTVAVDAVYLPSDSYIVSNAKMIAQVLRTAGVSSVGAIKKYISEGALMGSVADYYELGRQAAAIVHQHEKGGRLEKIPIGTPASPKMVLNRTTMALLGLELPEVLLKKANIIEK